MKEGLLWILGKHSRNLGYLIVEMRECFPKLTSDNIINYTKQDIRRVEVLFNLDYGVDMNKVDSLLNNIIKSNNKIIKEKSSLIGVRKFKDYNLEMIVII